MRRYLALLACSLLLAGSPALAAAPRLVADGSDIAQWKALASDQVRASLRRDSSDASLCLDYDFAGVSGYAVMRRALPLDWPRRFELVGTIKGSGATNDLQMKFVDASGDNVWWINRPNTALPARLTPMKIRERHVSFAWGPSEDKALRRTEALELVISAGREGGKGSLCLSSLTLVERAPDPSPWPEARQRRVDAQTQDFDFQHAREFMGLALQWPAGLRGLDYDLLASDDGRQWRNLRAVRGSDGGLDTVFLPESEARWLRVRQLRGTPATGSLKLTLQDWPDRNAMLKAAAATLPRGQLPRALLNEQNYWTLVGVDGGAAQAGLVSEDGAIELHRSGASIEPSLRLADGTSITWADVKLGQSLADGYLPMPRVHWRHPAIELVIEAAADGTRDASALMARYTLRNPGKQPLSLTFTLALRPWQVNPPQQFLSTQGGVSKVGQVAWRNGQLMLNGKAVLASDARPQAVTALPFDGGLSLASLQAAPKLQQLTDPQALASAALQYRITLSPGASRTIAWSAPSSSTQRIDQRFEAAAAHWRERLNRVQLQVPPAAQPIVDSLRTALAQILMSRQGPALQPGTRSYARSWVRDGAMMVAGLLRLGEQDAAREFVDWYGGQVFASGKVPCCVDQRGADPVVENDSHGQYLYAVAEVWRHTRDDAWLARHWPRVQQVADWIEQQRQSERTATNSTPARAHLFGLMPPSISHEGYSDKPAYALWDDFWTLRGLKDAVQIAERLNKPELPAWQGRRDEFQRELMAAIQASARVHKLDHIVGAADRGDFDPTSTTMALNPAQAQEQLPPGLLEKTFERYWQESLARAQGRRAWKDYTPYELRTVGAFVRLGQPERAHAMLDFFFKDQRPQGWNQWAEVVLPDYREPRFLGDMPHAWVSSDYIRSALDLFAYEREPQAALVIAAGLQRAWLDAGDIEVRGLSTPYGLLDYRIQRTAGGWALNLPARTARLHELHGGIRLPWPGDGPLPRALHQGRELPWQGRQLLLPRAPAVVQLIKQD
ncbi:hypothetical protein ABT392_12820 [Paucibacter sp. JuS9]|uniref:hypothetical protein n=1 Tax=Paucibacter sp. JuS9 TaxID=3228748 RepID=UPI0037570C35